MIVLEIGALHVPVHFIENSRACLPNVYQFVPLNPLVRKALRLFNFCFLKERVYQMSTNQTFFSKKGALSQKSAPFLEFNFD
jgi:hypothetical protein